MNKISVALISLFILLSAAASSYAMYSYHALDYDAVDGTFFMGFYEKLFEPNAAHIINPEGKNIFFFSGTDGATSLHQDIHFEPIKYFFGLIVTWFGPYAVMIAIALGAYSPLLYGAYLAHRGLLEKAGALLLVAYAVFPAVFFAASSGMRPSALLAAAVLLCFLSIIYRRPIREQLASFALLFLVREEAVVFGLFILLAVYARKERVPLGYLLLWVAGTFSFAAYMLWTGYPSSLSLEKISYHIPLPLLGAGMATGLSVCAFLAWRFRGSLTKALPGIAPLMVSGVALSVTLAHLIVDRRLTEIPFADLLRANTFAIAMAGLVSAGFVLLVSYRVKPGVIAPIAGLVIAGSILTQLVAPDFLVQSLSTLRKKQEAAALIWEARAMHPDRVLTDYDTIFPWYAAHETFAFERFPAAALATSTRFYPHNEEAVLAYLRDVPVAMVVSVRNRERASALADKAGREFSERASNERYVWFELAER